MPFIITFNKAFHKLASQKKIEVATVYVFLLSEIVLHGSDFIFYLITIYVDFRESMLL